MVELLYYVEKNYNDFEWKLIGTVSGTSSINIPKNAKEVYVSVYCNYDEYIASFRSVIIIPTICLSDTELMYRSIAIPYSADGTMDIIATKSYIKLHKYYLSDDENSSICETSFYYR